MKKLFFLTALFLCIYACDFQSKEKRESKTGHSFNDLYRGENLNRIAFPIGGTGAGMICLDGNGAFSHVSLRHHADVNKTPFMFAAVSVKGIENGAKILEGPVQDWKIFGNPGTGNGQGIFGMPRFSEAGFKARFPFAEVFLKEENYPIEARINGWSPFIPADADNSSLPVGGLEYSLTNTSNEKLELVFSFHSENFMRIEIPGEWGGNFVGKDSIMEMKNGFILEQSCLPDKAHYKGEMAIFTDEPGSVVDYCWFRGGWFDSRTLLWKNIESGQPASNQVSRGATGASLAVPFSLAAGETRTIKVYLAWHVPHSELRLGWLDSEEEKEKINMYKSEICKPGSACCPSGTWSPWYEPWYYSKFEDVRAVCEYWLRNYGDLKSKSELFRDCFYGSDLPPVILEAVAANLTILKSPTVMRQKDGRLWAWEGCHDLGGCCQGTCTHVWNYAQAIPHLFPGLERTIRETEFKVNQDARGHQTFRSYLPVREPDHGFYAAADGQLGGIMKIHREWKISGNAEWLKELWPAVKASLDYCILTWDPRHTGSLEEPHHNTYDIEFWGPDGMCTGFYLGALAAAIEMGEYLGDKVEIYSELLKKGIQRMEGELYNGEYFIQKVQWEGLNAPDPVQASRISMGGNYSDEALQVLAKEGPKYQYANGCISDGVLGFWIAEMCGVKVPVDQEKVLSHLRAVYKYNFKTNLEDHVNPQRASFAYGKEGGLLLCSWPENDEPTFPFVYSNEVWTGIEYQVASHLIMKGEVSKGLDIVEEVRKRYDGKIRNPFNEYECGHWYARAMSSYGLIQAYTGIRYDAVEQKMYLNSAPGKNYRCFFSCSTGFGWVGLKDGKPFTDMKSGTLTVKEYILDGNKI